MIIIIEIIMHIYVQISGAREALCYICPKGKDPRRSQELEQADEPSQRQKLGSPEVGRRRL